MYTTGDFVASTQQFGAELRGPSTAQFMDYLVNDLGQKHWDSIFNTLSSSSRQVTKEEAIHNNAPEEVDEHVPLPLSYPPSPPCDD